MRPDNPPDVHAGYFQLQDHLALDFRLTEPPGDTPSDNPDSPLFGMLGELQVLEHESQHLLRQIGERDRVLAACLKTFSKRIDLLAQATALQLTSDLGSPMPVVISEAGLSFTADIPLEPGQWIALRLLLSNVTGMATLAQIADCRRDPASGHYAIQVSFHHSETQRQLLARYIVQRQAQDIRAAKQNERTST